MTSLLTASLDSFHTVLAPLAGLVPLASEAPEADEVNTGWWYVLVFFALLAATILLWLSMRKQLKKIRFEEKPAASDADGDAEHRDEQPPTS